MTPAPRLTIAEHDAVLALMEGDVPPHALQTADIDDARATLRERWCALDAFCRDALPDPAMHEYHRDRYRDALVRLLALRGEVL